MGPMIEKVQNTIDYQFENLDLIQQAFIRRSYTEENGGENNEVLEYIGDKALDLAVIRILMERFGSYVKSGDYSEFKLNNSKTFKTQFNEGEFTDIKKQLVQKGFLASAMTNLGFHEQLLLGKGDIKNNIQEQDSVKEDLFEAIIGAVALDSNWDMDVITDVVENMIDFDDFFSNKDHIGHNGFNYTGLLQEWCQKNGYTLPNYSYGIDDKNSCYICYLTLELEYEEDEEPEIGYFEGSGSSQAKARADCAKEAYLYLKDNGYILSPYEEEVGLPLEEDSLRQINELYQKGLILEPRYTFKQSYDEDGNSIWKCKCIIQDRPNTYTNTASSKKEAQRMSAYEMLLDLMGKTFEDLEEDEDSLFVKSRKDEDEDNNRYELRSDIDEIKF